MRFEVLGPLAVFDHGDPIEIRSPMARTVLSALLLHANTTVNTNHLIEVLWAQDVPTTAPASLHNHVMRLRRVLGEEGGSRIRTMASGYQIRVEPGELDLHTFTELCVSGHAAESSGSWAKASEDLAAALALWRGAPTGDSPDPGGQLQQLVEARWRAWEGRIEADLQLGRQHEVLDELRALTADHPLREVFHGQLMLAQYRADKQDEALATFEALRRTLVDKLGVDPSPSLQSLHRQILSADLRLREPEPASGPRFLLPSDTREFTGREHELDQLVSLAHAAPEGTEAGMVVISAIDGMGGVGKTTLAVHAAHRLRRQFPDGQLFLDLRGYTTGLDPLTAGDALDRLLHALGVPPQLIPADLGERAAFYRNRLDRTRTLIILDNAYSAAQVRPLLPDGPDCLVLVTSRKRLTGLDDAHTLALGTLSTEDAVTLLHKVAGAGRIPAHHPAISELIALCGHIPLAIRITAARLNRHPDLRIDEVVRQLRDDTARLEHLKDEERNLAAIFDQSYNTLPLPEQQLFRSLSLIPGPDFDAYAAANLTGTDHRTAERLLESLLDHNLLAQHTVGRYRFHDLVRVYARAVAANDVPEDHQAALDRLLDFYQYSAESADRHLARYTRPVRQTAAKPPTAAPDPADRADALAWLRTERDNLLAAVAHALTHTRQARAIALTAALAALFQQDGPWGQAAALHQAAADAAHQHRDSFGEADALHDLGRVRLVTGDYPATTSLMERALAIYREVGDRQGEANALWALGRVQQTAGDYPAATDLLDRTLAIYQDLGDRQGEGNTLWELGRVWLTTGAYPAAADLLERSLAIYHDVADRQGEANTLCDLGRVRLQSGDFSAAVDLLERALTVYRGLDSRQGEASALWDLGRVRLATGDLAVSAGLQERALALFQELGSRHGAANALSELGRVRHASGDFSAALSLHERALMVYRNLGQRQSEANALWDLGRARQAIGDHSIAAELLECALGIFREIGDRQGEVEVLISTGALLAETSGPVESLALYHRALHLAREIHSPMSEARALEGSASCLEQTGELTSALADLHAAMALYERLGAAVAGPAAAHLATLGELCRSAG